MTVQAPLGFCPASGCSVRSHGPCPAHRSKLNKVRDLYRGSRQSRGYDEDWVRLRNAYITEHPFCEDCEEQGRTRLADEVHHKIPFRVVPELRLEWSNLRSLCVECHHEREQELRS